MRARMFLLLGWMIAAHWVKPATALEAVEATYENGQLVVQGQTRPNTRVTLDERHETRSGPKGRFSHALDYRPDDCTVVVSARDEKQLVSVTNCVVGGLPLGSTPLVDEYGEEDPGATFKGPRIVDPTLGDPTHAFDLPPDLVVPRR